jgi:hypothetical protein
MKGKPASAGGLVEEYADVIRSRFTGMLVTSAFLLREGPRMFSGDAIVRTSPTRTAILNSGEGQ